MTPSKEVIDAAEEYEAKADDAHIGCGSNSGCCYSTRRIEDAFIAGDTSGYSRAMERIEKLESACVEIRSQMKRNDLDTLKVYGHLFKMLDQALKGT